MIVVSTWNQLYLKIAPSTLFPMRKIQFLFCLTLTLTLIVGCKPALSSTASAFYKSLSADQKALIDGWKGDPYGCKKFRDAEKADQVLQAIQAAKVSQDDVVSLLGPAEESSTKAGKNYIGYYFDGECEGGKLKQGAVFCLLQLYFDATTKAYQLGSVICG
jgi:hypothetical protein